VEHLRARELAVPNAVEAQHWAVKACAIGPDPLLVREDDHFIVAGNDDAGVQIPFRLRLQGSHARCHAPWCETTGSNPRYVPPYGSEGAS
jgi:hypothetical protein